MSVKAVFFHIDGTLVDSNKFHVMAWEQALRESCYPASKEAIRKQIGKGADTLIPSLMPYSAEKTRQELATRHGQVSILSSDTFEFTAVFLLSNELAGRTVAFGLLSSERRSMLAALANGAVTVPITRRWVGCHYSSP
jgi:beta-phosphoglucomutase-like phosphatase (HAD superfamily)